MYCDRLGVLGGRAGDHLGGLLAEPGVVVQVALGVLLGAVAEREVGEPDEPRLALAAGLGPGGL